jgi:GNAT superfamily N-acetyltransferase
MNTKIFYKEDKLIIRSMVQSDIDVIYNEYEACNWHPNRDIYQSYFDKQEEETLHVIAAEYENNLAGYTTLHPMAKDGPFIGYPVIVDFRVFIKYRNKGIGNKILDVAEEIASALSDKVSLSVGLHYGYGAAHRIYIKRGYMPDGSGVWFNDSQLEQYADCKNDDNLVLFLSKELHTK